MFELLRRYVNEYISYDDGLSLVWLDALLLVPLTFAVFFYPVEVLTFLAIVAVVALVGYEGYVIWRKHHPSHA